MTPSAVVTGHTIASRDFDTFRAHCGHTPFRVRRTPKRSKVTPSFPSRRSAHAGTWRKNGIPFLKTVPLGTLPGRHWPAQARHPVSRAGGRAPPSARADFALSAEPFTLGRCAEEVSEARRTLWRGHSARVTRAVFCPVGNPRPEKHAPGSSARFGPGVVRLRSDLCPRETIQKLSGHKPKERRRS